MASHEDERLSIQTVLSDQVAPAPAADAGLVDYLVIANKILCAHGVVDAFGHVSVRHDKAPERFLLSRNLAPAQVSQSDIVEFDLSCNPVNASGRPVYLERFIHGSIYRARPDVLAIVHSHSHSVVPFGVSQTSTLKSLWHMSSFLGDEVPVFEIRDIVGSDSDLLITSNKLGQALADSLGDGPVVLMRGHGATIVAPDLRLAVFRAIYTQLNAELQMLALALGVVTYLSAGEALSATRSVGSQADRAWNMWKKEIGNGR
jgi:ribulose-5-phosphate 4-epimerase/fuculose-1-phosphate aldolase